MEGHFEFQGISDSSLVLTKMTIECPDIIILDYNMLPDDGLLVLRKIRWAGYTVPVILISGSRNPEIIEQALELGVDYVLSKPIDGDWLIHIINKLIQVR
jgi:CheY-like chemotaxis protein